MCLFLFTIPFVFPNKNRHVNCRSIHYILLIDKKQVRNTTYLETKEYVYCLAFGWQFGARFSVELLI
jgi:hypothetical protein